MSQDQPEIDPMNPGKLPDTLPILPLFDAALFPKMVLPLVVLQEESIALVDDAMNSDRIIGMVVARKPVKNVDPNEELEKIGCSAMILKMGKTEEKRAQILVQGIRRMELTEFTTTTPYLKAKVNHIEENEENDAEAEALMAILNSEFAKIVELTPGLPPEVVEMAQAIKYPGILADMVASTINVKLEEKQNVLGIYDIRERLRQVTRMVYTQLDILELGNKIQSQVKGDMDKRQREYYLREQLKAIREELGETDDANVEIDEYREKIEAKGLPEDARKEAERELNRLAKMHPSSSEYTVSTTYLDWLTALPWNESTEDNLDIKKAQKILDEDHFALTKPKKRIIEFLAVRKLTEASRSPILCFAGPPGTGKTSLGRSIAKAIGRKFIRISLGGVRDEAEIRGHRRTYVGALPGRIIQGIRRAESNNPIFILDEIDKVGSDFRGDPSSALLEVLDPEQNSTFFDHYLDVEFDLSKVIFLTTANVLDTIPPALRDRMEVIEMHGYTEDEKIKIANRYLIPRQRKAHGLKADQINFTRGAVKMIISGYTREAGLRNLEREIASVCRGVAARVATGEAEAVSVKVINIPKFLGPVKFTSETRNRTATPGVVMGLAWTQSGGEILFIEATAMPGKKGLMLTGQLGDVMKESAHAAMSFVRTNFKTLGIAEDFFDTHDIHIHIPAGAIPKDGPSAGVTMLTALTSIATRTPVKQDMAMTGEITLRGRVMPVGGIKEKVLAAHRVGVKTLVLPQWNEKDLEDIPKKVQKDIEFHFVEKMLDVLDLALDR